MSTNYTYIVSLLNLPPDCLKGLAIRTQSNKKK
ncbi:uncharacterized protein METZ01_LOCUS333348 [marine metagenome]|uniref:Uncharacterized protein n=1 Tax=marine metagenome TaxID=408172 RepID=A0A382Q4J4_9ZZZZ